MGVVGLRDVFVVAPAATFHPQPQHHHHQESLFSSQEHPIIPLLTAAPCLVDDTHDSRGKSTGIQFWQQQQQQNHHHHRHQHHFPNPNPSNPYQKKPAAMLETAGILTTTTSSGGGAACQDCGNQAKKDCSHRRCRTCCKSRGFDCSTHVKSTWVPATRRRERQLSGGAPASSASTSGAKKPRLLSSQTATTSHTSTSYTTRSFDTTSSHQDASFREKLPGQVKAPALFKCVRVTSVEDDGEDEYAYQAMVKIGGHVFKGFLYDQGADEGIGEPVSNINAGVDNGGNSSSSNNNAILNFSELHLGGGASNSGGGRNGPSTSAMVPAADVSRLLGGTNYMVTQ